MEAPPIPCFAIHKKKEEKKQNLELIEIKKFELIYKNIIYDTNLCKTINKKCLVIQSYQRNNKYNMYEAFLKYDDLIKLSKAFKICESIDDAYKLIVNLFNEKKVYIQDTKDDKVKIIYFSIINIINREEVKVEIEIKNNNKDSYIKKFVDEYNDLIENVNNLKKENENIKKTLNDLIKDKLKMEKKIQIFEDEINKKNEILKKVIELLKLITNDDKNYDAPLMLDEQIRNENNQQFKYELIMYLKEKSNDIFIYNEKYGLTKLKLPSNDDMIIFPDKSKFVNLGRSCLLTGGISKDETKLKKCYLITMIENESKEHYKANIIPYGEFKEGRERHNLLFLPDKDYIFACSGSFTKTCEFSDTYKADWESISPLSKSRGNATMAYINEQFIYILGGYDLNGNNKQGEYLNDIEYFDINNFDKGWTIINYMNNREYNIGLTDLGVVPISTNIFIICGGYDGKEYKSNAYKIDCTIHDHPTIEETQSLGNNTIFTHNLFCKINKSYFNFNFQAQMYYFYNENWRFGTLTNENK